MGIRETLNQNPAITTGGTLLVIVLAVGFIIYSQVRSGAPSIPTESFYTVDDGATWFADDIQKVPPFDKDGKQAVRVHLYRCGSEKPFVAYLERMTPEAKKALDSFRGKDPSSIDPAQAGNMSMLMQEGQEYKKPGGKEWIRMQNYQKFQELMNIRCPKAEDVPERVDP